MSRDNKLPIVERTPKHQNSFSNNSFSRLVEAIARIASQQRPQVANNLKPVSTNTMIFHSKSEEFDTFEYLFNTMLKMTEATKVIHFHARSQKEGLQTFRYMSALNRKIIEYVLIVFRRKYVTPESEAAARHNWHKLTFDPNTRSLSDFLEKLNERTERGFADTGQQIIDNLFERSINSSYLQNRTYDQVVAHPGRDTEFSGLENDDELWIPTMTAAPPNDNSHNTEK